MLFEKIIREPTKKYVDNEIVKNLKAGDIVLHRSLRSDALGSLTRAFTYSPYRHAEIYVGEGWCISAEAQGVSYTDKLHDCFIDVLRYKEPMTTVQLTKILLFLQDIIGRKYSIKIMFGFPFISPKSAIKLTKDLKHNCSELVSLAYKSAGLDLVYNIEEAIEAPADIARSKKLNFVGSWYKGALVSADENVMRNKEHSLQGKAKWMYRVLIGLIKFLSTRDETYKKMFEENETRE